MPVASTKLVTSSPRLSNRVYLFCYLVISCGKPQGLTTPGLGHDGSQFHYGSVIHFTCQANYIMEGKNVTRCEQDGQWSNKVPQCLG